MLLLLLDSSNTHPGKTIIDFLTTVFNKQAISCNLYLLHQIHYWSNTILTILFILYEKKYSTFYFHSTSNGSSQFGESIRSFVIVQSYLSIYFPSHPVTLFTLNIYQLNKMSFPLVFFSVFVAFCCSLSFRNFLGSKQHKTHTWHVKAVSNEI